MTTPTEQTRFSVETVSSLWTLCTLDAPPDIVLRDWQCMDMTPPGKATTRRFLGRNGESASICTSAPVTRFDPVQGIGEATDGALMRLVGQPSSASFGIPGYIENITIDIVELMKRCGPLPSQLHWRAPKEKL